MTRSGGPAGVTRQVALDTSGGPDAADLERLALAAVAGSRAVPAPGVPDGFQHTVTVTTASGCTTLCVVQ
ncbi:MULTISPECIES: protealysin inhibitor emfourin [Streptomyces]|uniref:protealysin inhibitor emfourin n=1 Tax=Streptomyces TaxID=1883 RepID=UPI0027E504BC|nr:protealysin inhibitor emfourin [Streptomyces sp. MCA2]